MLVQRNLFFHFSVLVFGIHTLFSCEFRKPETFFNGVDETGNLTYIEQFDEVDLGEGFKIPLVGVFKSNREYQSPYFGSGWILGLLDSHFIALSEKQFEMVQPDGWVRKFSRTSSDGKEIFGTQGWQAKITGNTVNVEAACGCKLRFINGKISEIETSQGKVFSYEYKNGRVDRICEESTTVFKVDWNESADQIEGFEYGNKKITVSLDQRPKVVVVNDKRLTQKTESALVSLTSSNQKSFQYEYGVDKELNPTFTVKGKEDRLMSWNPETKLIKTDRDWIFSITTNLFDSENSKIERVNSKGEIEFWWLDQKRGFERWSTKELGSYVKKWHVQGFLAGKIRTISEINGNEEKIVFKANYSDTGEMISYIDSSNRLNLIRKNELQ